LAIGRRLQSVSIRHISVSACTLDRRTGPRIRRDCANRRSCEKVGNRVVLRCSSAGNLRRFAGLGARGQVGIEFAFRPAVSNSARMDREVPRCPYQRTMANTCTSRERKFFFGVASSVSPARRPVARSAVNVASSSMCRSSLNSDVPPITHASIHTMSNCTIRPVGHATTRTSYRAGAHWTIPSNWRAKRWRPWNAAARHGISRPTKVDRMRLLRATRTIHMPTCTRLESVTIFLHNLFSRSSFGTRDAR
jgi:hypothetical protein